MGKIVAGIGLLVLSLGIVNAEEYIASISKVDGKKVMAKVVKYDPEAKGTKGKAPEFPDEAKMFTVAADAKFVKRGKRDPETKKAGEPTALDNGIKNMLFTDATTEKPLIARIKTNDKGEITEISVGGGKKGKKKAE